MMMTTEWKKRSEPPRAMRGAQGGIATHRARQRGASTVEVALMLPFLLLLLVGVVDFAQLFRLAIEVSSAARAGAQYGYQNSATQMDTAGMLSLIHI